MCFVTRLRVGRKLADVLSRPGGLISMQRKERRVPPLKSQLLAHTTPARRGEICSLKPIKRPEFYLFCFKGRRQRGPQGLLQDGSEEGRRNKGGGGGSGGFRVAVLGGTFAVVPGTQLLGGRGPCFHVTARLGVINILKDRIFSPGLK